MIANTEENTSTSLEQKETWYVKGTERKPANVIHENDSPSAPDQGGGYDLLGGQTMAETTRVPVIFCLCSNI